MYYRLFAFWKAFKELPQNQKYLNSPLANLPCNNVMAKWGSAPEPVCEYDRVSKALTNSFVFEMTLIIIFLHNFLVGDRSDLGRLWWFILEQPFPMLFAKNNTLN